MKEVVVVASALACQVVRRHLGSEAVSGMSRWVTLLGFWWALWWLWWALWESALVRSEGSRWQSVSSVVLWLFSGALMRLFVVSVLC